MIRPRATTIDRYEVVIFDCDGVIFDTNVMKNEAFVSVARDAGYPPEVVDTFARWQLDNFGISRYRVFDQLLAGSFGELPDRHPPPIEALVAAFAAKSAEIYDRAPETAGMRSLLEALAPRPLYIASGSAQEELRLVFERRALDGYFSGVYGSPTPKTEIVNRIARRERSVDPLRPILMVGDAKADEEAANSSAVDFLLVSEYSTAGTDVIRGIEAAGHKSVRNLAALLH